MEHCEIEIEALPKEKWKGVPIPLVTRSDSYYDLEISPLDQNGCTVALVRKTAEKEIVHTPEEYDFPDSLYQDHWEKAEAYGVLGSDGALLACIEVCPEEWSNRLMVTELWVSETLRRQGIGRKLMDKAKEIALCQNRRAIILETQSCNTGAIAFYLHEGFELIGFDTCCYTNNDIGRREVRLDLGYFLHKDTHMQVQRKHIEVAAAIITAHGRIFATQRGYGEFKDGWEFPGGKIEAGETPEQALKREIREELDTEIEVGKLFDTVEYDYPQFHLTLHCFLCTVKSGALMLKEHKAARWLTGDALDSVDWLPADKGLIKKLQEAYAETSLFTGTF